MSKRPTVVAFAVVSVLLLVIAPGAQALNTTMQSTETVVGSEHTDFGTGEEPAPTTLNQLQIAGSGDSASVVYEPTLIDDFEDGNLDEYEGAVADYSLSTSPALDSYALNATGTSTTEELLYDTDVNFTQGEVLSARMRVEADGADNGLLFATQQGVDSYGVGVTPSGTFRLFQMEGSSYNRTLASTQIDLSKITSEWAYTQVKWEEGNTINASLYYANKTKITSITATDDQYTSGGIGFRTFSGTTYFDDVMVRDTGMATYVSANHTVSGATQANVSIAGLSFVDVDAGVEVYDNGAWTTVAAKSLFAAGTSTLDFNTTDSPVRVRVNFSAIGPQPTGELTAESILFSPHAPQASNLSPANGTATTQDSVEFSVDVSDADFPTAQGDNVTTSLVLDGETVYSKTVSTNTTVSTSEMVTEGGDHEYYWTLEDDYGATTTTDTRTVTVPNTLYLYSEAENSTTGQHELLNGTNTSVEVTITGSAGSVKSVNVTDGKVNMTGLSADESYVFTVDADGYYPREIYIESIYDQGAVFLLSKDKTAVENSLTVTDRTNQFPHPIITVERVINTSRVPELPNNGDQWVTIGGDRLGASGFYIVNLQQSSRYRFVVINQAGDERVLGEYTAKVDGEVPLEIGSIEYDLGPSNTIYQWTTAATNKSGNPAISYAYRDDANLTEWVNVTFRYRNNSKIVASSNFTNAPYGELQYTHPVNATQYNNREFVVEWEASRNGSVISGKRIVGGKRTVGPPLSDVWMEIAYGTGVFLLAFLVGAGAGAPAAAVTVSIFAGLSVFIGLAPPALGFGATILGLFLSVAMLVYGGSDPPI